MFSFRNLSSNSSKQLAQKITRYLQYSQKTTFPYQARHFFQVVYEVEKYSEFLPWCSRVEIKKRSGESYFEAELFVNFKVYQESYVSKVTAEASDQRMKVVSISNNTAAFKSLKSTWIISPVNNQNQCTVNYDIDFEFRNIFFQTVAQMFLDTISKTINASFEERVKFLLKSKYFETHPTPLIKDKQVKNHSNVVAPVKIEATKVEPLTQEISKNSNQHQESRSLKTDKEDLSTQNQTATTTWKRPSGLRSEEDIIGEYLEVKVNQGVLSSKQADKYISILLTKGPDIREQIIQAYKFFIVQKALIDMEDKCADLKFMQCLESSLLY